MWAIYKRAQVHWGLLNTGTQTWLLTQERYNTTAAIGSVWDGERGVMETLILVWHSIASLLLIKQAEIEVLRPCSPAFKTLTYTEHLFPLGSEQPLSTTTAAISKLQRRLFQCQLMSCSLPELMEWDTYSVQLLKIVVKCWMYRDWQISGISMEVDNDLGWIPLIWLWYQAAAHVSDCWLYSHMTETYTQDLCGIMLTQRYGRGRDPNICS